ncbi:hypothetical protein ACVWZ4_004298 [Bradyrhizobium sp. USDA 4472]
MIDLVADQIDITFDEASNSLAVTFASCATGIISENLAAVRDHNRCKARTVLDLA